MNLDICSGLGDYLVRCLTCHNLSNFFRLRLVVRCLTYHIKCDTFSYEPNKPKCDTFRHEPNRPHARFMDSGAGREGGLDKVKRKTSEAVRFRLKLNVQL